MSIKLKDLLFEQPPRPASPSGKSGGQEEPEEKPLKTDIPDSPFSPDIQQVLDKLEQILLTWEKKQYKSDESRWKNYYFDIKKLVSTIHGEKDEV